MSEIWSDRRSGGTFRAVLHKSDFYFPSLSLNERDVNLQDNFSSLNILIQDSFSGVGT